MVPLVYWMLIGVVGLQRRHPLGDGVLGQPFALGDQRVPVVGADVDDPLESGVLRRGLLDHLPVVARLEGLRADQQLQSRLVHRVGELVGAVGRVDVDQDGADLGAGVLRDRPLRAVRRPHPHPVALLDPRADQAPSEGVHVPVELGVGPATPGGVLDQRLVVAVRRHDALEVGADGLLDQGRGWSHRLRRTPLVEPIHGRPSPASTSRHVASPVDDDAQPFEVRRHLVVVPLVRLLEAQRQRA